MVKAAGIGAVSLGLSGVSVPLLGRVRSSPSLDDARAGSLQDRLFPPPEQEGGWSVASPGERGVDPARFADAMAYHDRHVMTTSYGGALVVVYNERFFNLKQ